MTTGLPVKLRIAELNVMPNREFVIFLGRIYEHSPWVAEAVVNLRPFLDFGGLRDAMRSAVDQAANEKQMDLIRAHPDLAGRLAQQGQLTPESTREQASAGLTGADADVIARIQELNTEYRGRFGFPFIICARLNNVSTILGAMEKRVGNGMAGETGTAIAEIHKIANLRLEDIIDH